MSGVTYERAPNYEQAEERNHLLAGIHAALTKDIPLEDYDFLYRTVIAGGGPVAYPVGSIIVTEKGTYKYPWAVMHHGRHPDGRYYMHMRVAKAVDQLQFDAGEAFYYAENGLAAGKYYVTVSAAWSNMAAGDYSFTLANAVPAGGRLVGFYRCADVNPVGTYVTVYDSANSTVVSQTSTAIVKETDGTYLGTLAAGGDENNTNMNSVQRCGYGSNNYAQSNIRQYLNSDAVAGSVWKSSNKFDQPPGWNASQPGFLTKLPDGFLKIVNPIEIATVTNTVFETDYTKSSSYTLKDKFWLPSRYQIYGSTEGADLSETQWDYYKGSADIDKIMYDNGGTARHQFLRTPIVGHASNVRYVNASAGALRHYTAYGSYAVAPACEISAPETPVAI